MLHALTMGRLPCRRHVPFLSTHNPCCPTLKLLSTSPCGHPLSSPFDTSPCAVPCWHITSLLLPLTSTVGHLLVGALALADTTPRKQRRKKIPDAFLPKVWTGCGCGSLGVKGGTGVAVLGVRICQTRIILLHLQPQTRFCSTIMVALASSDLRATPTLAISHVQSHAMQRRRMPHTCAFIHSPHFPTLSVTLSHLRRWPLWAVPTSASQRCSTASAAAL